MICNCGSETRYSAHVVRSLDKAKEWYSDVKASDLPIIVRKDECLSCGRIEMHDFRIA